MNDRTTRKHRPHTWAFALPSRLVLCFALLCAILTAIGGVFFFSLRAIENLNEAERSSAAGEITLLNRIDKNLRLRQVEVFRHVAAPTPQDKQRHEEVFTRLGETNTKLLADYQHAADTEVEKRLLAELLEARKAYRARTEQLLALSRAQRNVEAMTFVVATQVPAFDRYQSSLDALLGFELAEGRGTAATTTGRIEQTRILGDILIGFAIIIALGTGVAVWSMVGKLKRDKKKLQTEVAWHKLAEQALREGEARYRLLVDHSPDAIFVVCDEKIVFANPTTLKLLGADRFRQLVGRSVLDILHPDDRAEVARRSKEVAAGRQPPAAECRLLRLDGSVAEVESRVISFLYEGKPAVQVIAQDNTERKTAAAKLQAQEKQFRLLFDDNPTPMWVFDIQTLGILAVNQSAITGYGYSQEEFLRLTLKDIRPAEDVERLVLAVGDEGASSSYGGEWRHLKKDGTIITAAVYSSPTTFEGKAARVTLAIDRTERVEAERMMRESEANLALAQKVAGVGSWEYQFTPEGRIDEKKLTWSQEAYRLFGVSSDIPISTEAFFRTVHLEDRALFARRFTAFMEDKAPLKTDFRIVRPDRTERIVHAVAQKIFDSHSGKLFKVVGTVLDITERREVEKKLREADEKYRSIFENASEGIFQNTPEGVLISANPALARMLGFASPEELIRERNDVEQQGYAEPAKRQEFKRLLEEKGVVENFEYEVKRKDGSTIWVSENVRIVRDDSGKALYYEGSAQDITERKRAEATSTLLAAIVESSDDAIIGKDMHGVITSWNRGAERIFGYTAGEIVGASILRLIPFERQDEENQILTKIARGESVEHFETVRKTKDGRLIDISITASPIRDVAGEIVGVSKLARNITEAKEAQRALRESDERFHQLADNISDVFWITSPDLKIMHYVSPAYEQIWGRSEASLYANPHQWVENILREDRERVLGVFGTLMTDAPQISVEYRIARPDGSIRWVQDRGFQIREGGEVIRLAGTVTDITERKRTEGELQRQTGELRVLFDLMPAMIWFKDAENGILRVNKRVADAAGKTIEEIEGKQSSEIYPDDAARYYQDDLKVIHSGVSQLGIVESVRGTDGKDLWVQTDKVPVVDRLGKVIGIVVMAQDITERRKSEQTLRLLNSAVLQSNEAILITDAELDLPGPRILFANPAFTAMTGYEAAEVIGKTPRILQGPRTDKSVLVRLRQDLKQGKVFKGEAVNYRKDGSEFDLEWQIAPIRDANDKVTHFVALQRDITARRQTEQTQARFAAIMAATPDFVGVADGNGRLLYMNSAGRKMVGFTEDEDLTKTTIADSVAKSQIHRLMEECIPTAMREGVWSGEMTFVDRKGREIPLSQVIVTHKTPAGNIDFVATTAQDLTERKKADTALEDANRQLLEASRLAGMAEVATSVLHNVGNVLNSVNVSCSVISDRVRGSRIGSIARTAELLTANSRDLGAFFANDPVGRKLPEFFDKLAVRLATEQTDILGELQLLSQNIEHIKDIVAVQQNHAKDVGGVRETLPMEGLVEDALRMNAGALVRHRIEVVREYGEAPPFSVEKHKVIQILVNLVRNAKHALTDGGGNDKRLVVRIARRNGNVAVSVSDNGIGIEPENKIRIFSHGFTTKKDGHGFGLHSGVLAAQEMGGSLVAHSDGHGKGATFTLELPISSHGKN